MDGFKVPTLPSVVEKDVNDVAGKAHEATVNITADVIKGETTEAARPVIAGEATCPYKVPAWSGPPSVDNVPDYKFEVLKNGLIIDEVKQLQAKAVWKFGRLPANDIEMAHPTISRFHAVLQYKPKQEGECDDAVGNGEMEMQQESHKNEKFTAGWYVYDLGSTHGTFLNKQRIPKKTYIRIKVGHMLRLGASTRFYILQGPSSDEEPESALSITELRALRQQKAEEKLLEAQRLAEEREREREQAGVSWGMMEDADEETDLTVNPYASSNNEELFLDDPKRTLRGFFEREGLELVYKCDEMSAGSFVCRVELPLDDSNGRPIVAEVIHKGRKKECVVQCALEACRILDRYGVLRQANQEPLKRKSKTTDSDEDDDFWDRTGDVERKKMRKLKTSDVVTLTYEDLLKQETELLANLEKVQKEIEQYQQMQKRQKATQSENNADELDLDSFMKNLSNDDGKKFDKTEVRKLRLEEQRLKAEHVKLQRLLKVAKPFEMPFTKTIDKTYSSNERHTKTNKPTTKQLPMIGKRNQFSKFKLVKLTNKAKDDGATATASRISCIPTLSEEEQEDDEDTKSPKLKDSELEGPSHEKQNEQKNYNDEEESASINIKLDAEADKKQNMRKHKTSDDNSELEHSSHDNPNADSTVVDHDSFNSNNRVGNHSDSDQEQQQKSDSLVSAKKRRNRPRLRNKRSEVDIEELAVHESADKYAKWVPPENQTGDGFTKLNEKFGY